MQNLINISGFEKKNSRRGILVQAIILTSMTFVLVGCSETVWQKSGDSCILLSEKPPLRRVINYTDHDLCGRKLPPRIPPNPQTRAQNEND
ncbi:MAG: hypothetical protein VYD14_04150 [SAR324 cluster bacterium]|nr:hypothetical protein [SAR324 cluster bacterium]